MLYLFKIIEMKGLTLKLKEMPSLYFGNPNVKVGNSYEILDVEGSNVWIKDEDGIKTSFSKHRFDI
jgi:hypothetical protein